VKTENVFSDQVDSYNNCEIVKVKIPCLLEWILFYFSCHVYSIVNTKEYVKTLICSCWICCIMHFPILDVWCQFFYLTNSWLSFVAVSPKAFKQKHLAGSSIPFCAIEKQTPGSWSQIEASSFRVRGKNYLR